MYDMLVLDRKVSLWHLDRDSFGNAEPLVFHVLDHSNDCLERRTLNWLPIVSHYLPAFPCAKSALDAEGDILGGGRRASATLRGGVP